MTKEKNGVKGVMNTGGTWVASFNKWYYPFRSLDFQTLHHCLLWKGHAVVSSCEHQVWSACSLCRQGSLPSLDLFPKGLGMQLRGSSLSVDQVTFLVGADAVVNLNRKPFPTGTPASQAWFSPSYRFTIKWVSLETVLCIYLCGFSLCKKPTGAAWFIGK